MDNSKISVIIPLYNSEKFIKNCVDSVLNQSYKNIELIVINDGSTDDSLEICKRIKDNRLLLISQNNFGAPSARNNGLKNATGEYIMFLDSDDVLEKDAIEKLYKKIKKEKADIAYGRTIHIDEKNNLSCEKIITPKVKLLNEEKNYYSIDPYPGNKLYKLDIIKRNNITFGNVRIGQDLNFYLKFMPFCKKISFCNEIVSYYRIVNNSISRTINFNIFDIINSFKDVEKFYRINKVDKENYIILESIKIYHYINQMKKLRSFSKISDRKLIYLYFNRYLKEPLKKGKITVQNKRVFKLKKIYLHIVCYIPFIKK